MNFRAEDYGAGVAAILAHAGGGKRPMPLLKPASAPRVKALEFLPDAVQSGLYLYLGCWDAAHSAADSVEDPNGYFWHGIVHRQEPDAGNAGYWFGKTGKHPVFPRLAGAATEAGYGGGREWDPFAFVEFCESASRKPGSAEEDLAMQVQLLEWQRLFDYCARGENC